MYETVNQCIEVKGLLMGLRMAFLKGFRLVQVMVQKKEI